MSPESMEARLADAQVRLDQLVHGLDGAHGPSLSQEALLQVSAALAELQVATEEIEQQHQELAETRRLLEEERERYEQHFHAAPDAYLVTTPRAIIEEANRAAVRLLQVDRDYLVGKPLVVFVRRVHQQPFFAGLAEARAGSARWECAITPRGRDPIPVEIVVSASAGGEAYRWLLRDVSAAVDAERRLREALQREQGVANDLRRLDRLKSDFLLVASHNLRTPIASILRTSELIDESSGDFDQSRWQRALDIILDAAAQLSRLNQDLLDLERIAANEIELRPEKVDLVELVRDVAEREGIDRDVEIDAEATVATVDPALVRRIVANLVDNADRHTPPEARIGITVRPDGESGRSLLVVWDTGDGVPDGDRETIFEVFQRGSSSADGTGIGLHLVSEFANLHGGRAWVEDRPGGGAQFCVTLADIPARGGGRLD